MSEQLKRYRVSYGYRTDDGLNYSGSTEVGSVEVDASDPQAARLAAIDAAYDSDPYISHVRPRMVVEVREQE